MVVVVVVVWCSGLKLTVGRIKEERQCRGSLTMRTSYFIKRVGIIQAEALLRVVVG